MPDITEEKSQYDKDYDKAAADLEAAAQATTARGADGKFVKAEEKPVESATPAAPVEVKPAEPAKPAEPVDPLVEIRTELEKAQKALKDTQAWGTKNAQELAEIKREREKQQRESTKPAILDANPELADAIRYVASDPAPQQQQADLHQQWMGIVDAAHPGIFGKEIDPELEKAVVARRDALGEAWSDPLVAIREITAEKLAHAERQVGKRFAAESAKMAQKSAMSVPGAGAGASHVPVDSDLEAVQRIQKMSDAEFQKEVRRVKGY